MAEDVVTLATTSMPNVDVGSLLVPPRALTMDLTSGIQFVYDGQLPPEIEQSCRSLEISSYT